MRGRLPSGAPFLALACVLTLLVQRSFLLHSDEGHTLSAAWNMWNGRRMYDDFRLWFSPGSGYAVYLTWGLVGSPSFLAARVTSLLLAFSSNVAVYLILARRGVRGVGLALSVLAWVIASAQYVLLNHNTFSSFAACWCLFLFLRAQERDRDPATRRLRDHVWVGVSAGVVVLFLQTKGLMVLAATAGFTFLAAGLRRGVRAAAVLVGGAVAVVTPLFLVWRPGVLVREWFLVALSGGYLGHTGASRGLAIACVLVAGGVAAIALRLRDRLLIAIAVFQAVLVASFLYNVDVHHAAINSFPLLVFVPLALRRWAERRATAPAARPEKFPATVILAIAVAMFAVVLATPVGRPFFRQSTLYVDFIRRQPRNLFPQPRVAAAHAIYAGPFMPGLYFALGKKNPFFVAEMTVCNDEACQLRLLAEVQEVKPEIAFLNYDMIRHLGMDPNNPVDAYFRDRYVRCPNADYEALIVRAVDPTWCP